MQSVRRSRAERFAAWVVTGPFGHLWSALADVVVLLARYGAAWIRNRVRSG